MAPVIFRRRLQQFREDFSGLLQITAFLACQESFKITPGRKAGIQQLILTGTKLPLHTRLNHWPIDLLMTAA
jgi:hypothetical protein